MEKKFDREFIADLACFMKGYVKEIRDHLIDEVEAIAADPMIRKLLHEYRERVEKADADFLSDLDWCLNKGYSKPDGESVLIHSKSYHDVLDDLLVKEWWHEFCEAKRAKEEKGDAA